MKPIRTTDRTAADVTQPSIERAKFPVKHASGVWPRGASAEGVVPRALPSLNTIDAEGLATLRAVAEAAKVEKPGEWSWMIEDHTMASLTASGVEYPEMSPVFSVSPCDSCADRSTEWEFGRCLTPSKAIAVHLAAFDPTTALALIDQAERAAEAETLLRELLVACVRERVGEDGDNDECRICGQRAFGSIPLTHDASKVCGRAAVWLEKANR